MVNSLLVLLPLLAAEPDPSSIDAVVAGKFDPYLARRPWGDVVVGVIEGEHRRTLCFGKRTEGGESSPPNGATLYEIGSITKVFTGLVLARMVVEGTVALGDRLADRWPEIELSESAQKITLQQLATHTSALPRLPPGLFADTLLRRDNPYAGYSRERLDRYLAKCTLQSSPTESAHYSNLGVGLLGDLLARKANLSYEELVQRLVARPLGLEDTIMVLSDDQQRRFIVPHNPDGTPGRHWEFQALAGAGGLLSTADDMLRFLSAYLTAPADQHLAAAIELSVQPHWRRSDGSGIGLCWQFQGVESADSLIYWHNGGTGGFVSFCSFHRPSRTGIVLLSNTGDALRGDMSLTRIGFELQRLLIMDNTRDDISSR